MDFLPGFITVISLHAIAVMMPGPDFALILRIALQHGKKNAIWASLGVSLGLTVHIGYSIIGISWLSEADNFFYVTVVVIAAAYLIYLGGNGCYKQLQSSRPSSTIVVQHSDYVRCRSFTSFSQGWLTNALNPKVSLFFIALFSIVIDGHTPALAKAIYVLEMMLVTFLWFAIISLLLTSAKAQRTVGQVQQQLLWVTNLVLLMVGLILLYSIL